MKKYALSGIIILAIIAYVIYQQMGGQASLPIADTKNSTGQTVATTSTNTNNQPAYKDGSYISPVVDAYYGNLQVKAIIKNGLLTDVQFIDYPQKNENDIMINNRAMPILKTEAITAQSAQVNIVSGATQTSEAFQQSLAAALAMAKN